MRRLLMNSLITWKKKKKRNPILLSGAKKTGKTWLLKEFGRTQFAKTAYISCENNENIERLFSGDLSVPRIISGLASESMCQITPEDTLIIFDEISENPKAMVILDYFCHAASEYYVVCACSRPSSCADNHSFLEDERIEVLRLYPMSFVEFIEANGSKTLCASLKMHDFGMIDTFRAKLMDFLGTYLFVGGMPEAVLTYVETKDPAATRAVQKKILCEIERDFAILASRTIRPKILHVWRSIPDQLGKANKKFLFGRIQKGAHAEQFEQAVTILARSGYVHKVCRISEPTLPLNQHADSTAYKLYMLDVGLLSASYEPDGMALPDGAEIFDRYYGALTEQFVCQELMCAGLSDLFYWTAVNSIGEIDFVFQTSGIPVPIDVRTNENPKSKKLSSFCSKFGLRKALSISFSDYQDTQFLTNVPIYAISWMTEFSGGA